MLQLDSEIETLPLEEGRRGRVLPEGTPIRNLCRADDGDEFGAVWVFAASLDGGQSWQSYRTVWNGDEPFPVRFE